MRSLCTLLTLVILHQSAVAQWAIPAQMRAENTLDRLSDINGIGNSDILYGIPLPVGNMIGDNYLDKKWNVATILLYQSEAMIEGYPVKYDIKANLIEIKTIAGIKVLDVNKVRSLVWKDSVTHDTHFFINAAEYKKNGAALTGLLEVMVDGNRPLMKKTELYVKKPTYNPALDMGTRDYRIYQRHSYLCSKDGELYEITSKADILSCAGGQGAGIETFLKENKVNIRKEPGILKAFEFINRK
jgi:hypothetical protein